MTERKAEAKKRCSKCKQWKARSEFYRNRRSKDGIGPRCKGCVDAYNKKRYAEGRGIVKKYRRYEDYHRVVDGVIQKECSACKEWKGENRFYKHRRHYHGLADVCKVCADKATNKCRRRRKAMAEDPGLAEIVVAVNVA